MATVYIREYTTVQLSPGGNGVQCGFEPGVDQQTITLSGSSQQSAVFATETKFIRITSDGIFSLLFGANPTVTANNARIPANATEFFGVVPGQCVAVISNT